MTASTLTRALPCTTCGARAGDPCVRRDGSPLKRSHVGRTPLAPCGTNGGRARHVKAGETPCDPCQEAGRRYMAEYRARRPEVRERDIAGLVARREATKRLIAAHRDEFLRLLDEVAS